MDDQGFGPFVRLLPYVELDNQYRLIQFDTNIPPATPYWINPLNRPPTGSVIPTPKPQYGLEGNYKVFQCPSAPPPAESANVYLIRTLGRVGVDYPPAPVPAGFFVSSSPGNSIMGRTNYIANFGFLAGSITSAGKPVPVDGPFRYGRGGRGIPVTSVTDGTSHTYFFSEAAGGRDPSSGTTVLQHTWSFALYFPQFGMCPHGGTGSVGTAWTSNCNNFRPRYPNSKHASGVINFAMGDGSVRSVNTAGMDLTPWVLMNSIHDGFVAPSNF
jgi:prepilin-type processing-associated H-X9-DG protein